jgi:ketosteroid isomerase-like protein
MGERKAFSPAEPGDRASVARWVADWGAEVAGVDLEGARHRFADDVVAFGTRADVVRSLDALVDEQWSRIWPTIAGFAFVLDDMEVTTSGDRLLAVAVTPWRSIGFTAPGTAFDRPGRATIVLRRPALDEPWLAVHTHFSLVPPIAPGSAPGGAADGRADGGPRA